MKIRQTNTLDPVVAEVPVIHNKTSLIAYHRTTALAKIPRLVRYIDNVVARSNSKIIIFAHHKIVLDAIEENVAGNDIDYIRILMEALNQAIDSDYATVFKPKNPHGRVFTLTFKRVLQHQ
ncbi:hypothetical protein BDB00DRAFT_558145 [Zychaea mexicana]|uniref:uncharacterized protein n=1 Tax=Zychaea mexicana TaxID=64656 RepID=UPI0022FE530D|nr:uncharacterized protein BDB00DRAFT_558145 [Zychaea mexicana]KAI9490335.1 hypothetical protein BDB00DRAFT_558145 [Zychaea mexicana]